jgi:hypothetical protein
LGRTAILRLIQIIALKEYKDYHDKHDEVSYVWEGDYEYSVCSSIPMWCIPEGIRYIIGLSQETYQNKNNWFFDEVMEEVDYFDYEWRRIVGEADSVEIIIRRGKIAPCIG